MDIQEVDKLVGDLSALLHDGVSRDLSVPATQESVINDFAHLLKDAGHELNPVQFAQVKGALTALFSLILYLEKKESVNALIETFIGELPLFLGKL